MLPGEPERKQVKEKQRTYIKQELGHVAILVLLLEMAAGIDGSPILAMVIMELFKALVNGLFFEHEQEYN